MNREGQVWQMESGGCFLVSRSVPAGCMPLRDEHHYIVPLTEDVVVGADLIFEFSFHKWKMTRIL